MGPIAANAESIESLEQKENQLLEQSQSISADVQTALDSVNQKYQEVESLKVKISENEATLADTQAAIEETEQTIEYRKEIIAERLKSLQLNRTNENKLAVLLQSSSVQEFVSGLYAITMLQSAEKEEITGLQEETEKLQELEAKVTATQEELETSEATLEEEANALDTQISSLQTQLANNQTALAEISKSKAVETQRLEAEEARKAAEKAEAEKQAAEASAQAENQVKQETTESTNSTSSNGNSNAGSSNSGSESSSNNNSTENNNNQSSGKVLYMESTAYSYKEAGASYYTALGIDLRENPQVVAVDTSVIPLGTLVEVEGYGVAIAGDTGGAIKGNIIDVHLTSVDACHDWGRRFNVKVTILG